MKSPSVTGYATSSDSVNGSKPSVSSRRATRIAIASESSPESSSTRSSVSGGRLFPSSSAICSMCEMTVALSDMDRPHRRRDANAVMRRLDVALDDARRVAGDERPRRHVAGDDAGGRDDAAVADRDAGQDDRVRADEAVVADGDVAVAAVDVVVRHDGRPERDDGVLPDVDAARV